ncbi:MAG: carboxypeptidase-like regulatory domain-containing protein, partial [Planctomycetia bacterium]|nr:carboxypeptidase-like regulatory domain-containing protein [Planctomycetia bacterium]
VTLQVRDERFAPEWLVFWTAKEERAEPVVLSASPARILEGKLTTEDTNQPLANATLIVETANAGPFSGSVQTRTDKEGRFRVRPFPGKKLRVWVYPPQEQPYITVSQEVQWPGDEDRGNVDLTVPRGILIRGTVQEAGSGRRIVGAGVHYSWHYTKNPFREIAKTHPGVEWRIRAVRTGSDGGFYLVVPPGPGTLQVKAAEPDYIHIETNSNQLNGRASMGGAPYFPDAVVPMSLLPESGVQHPVIKLRRGITVRGRVTGHDGKPVLSALLISPTYIPDGLELKGRTLPVRDGRFELPGCEPGKKVIVWILDPSKKQGAVSEFTAQAGAEPEVRLAPCVSVRLRVVDTAGKLVPQPKVMNELLLRPGDPVNLSIETGNKANISVWTVMVYGRGYEAIQEKPGELIIPYLIPNAKYLIRAQEKLGWPEKMTFTAPATGSRDLTLTIEPRQPAK